MITSHVVIDTATMAGRVAFDLVRKMPMLVEWRDDARRFEGCPPEVRERELAAHLDEVASREGVAILTEHAQTVEGNLIRRWALAVEKLPAPPDPRLEPHPWRSGA